MECFGIGARGRGGIYCNWGVGPWRHVNDHNKFVVMLPLGNILDSLNTDSQHTCECIKSMRSNQPITFAHAESKHQTEQAQRLLINEASSEHTCHKKGMRCEHVGGTLDAILGRSPNGLSLHPPHGRRPHHRPAGRIQSARRLASALALCLRRMAAAPVEGTACPASACVTGRK